MGSVVFAVLAATCFAASQVTLRRGLVATSVLGGILVSITASLAVLGVAAALTRHPTLDARAITLFALSGIAAPGLARWAGATGVQRLGPSVAVPIMQGSRPLLAVMAAVVLLAEPLGLQRGAGLLLIVAGGWKLSRRHRDATEGLPRQFLRPGATFPLLAGLCYAASDILVKQGLAMLPDPPIGALIATASALGGWAVVFGSTGRVRRQIRVGPDVGWQALSGALSGAALLLLFNALQRGDVTLVSPILASQPLAVFLLSRLLLRDLERLRLVTVFAGCGVVIGAVLVSW